MYAKKQTGSPRTVGLRTYAHPKEKKNVKQYNLVKW